MSKLMKILESVNEIDEVEYLIAICSRAMIDSKNALVRYPDSEELNRIYEASKLDKERLQASHEKLSSNLSDLLDSVQNDTEFAKELESINGVDEDLQKTVDSLKKRMNSMQVYEKTAE